MPTEPTAPERALAAIIAALDDRQRPYALVGGLAISVRAEVRFTRDVDLAVGVADDPDAEALVRDLGQLGYRPLASVEHEIRKRLSTVRLSSPQGITVDLLFASCGIEGEIAVKATPLDLPSVGTVRVARAEDLLAMKILSMREARLQDRIDAQHLLEFVPDLDLDDVRRSLQTIAERGYDRDQDLMAKLSSLLEPRKPAA